MTWRYWAEGPAGTWPPTGPPREAGGGPAGRRNAVVAPGSLAGDLIEVRDEVLALDSGHFGHRAGSSVREILRREARSYPVASGHRPLDPQLPVIPLRSVLFPLSVSLPTDNPPASPSVGIPCSANFAGPTLQANDGGQAPSPIIFISLFFLSICWRSP